MRFLVTGTAGFIGFHVARELLKLGHTVTGIDGMTPYYDVRLKHRRHQALAQMPGFEPHELLIEDYGSLETIWRNVAPDMVIHLAAQAGVRYSVESPASYIDANLRGTFSILELARHFPIKHLLLASTSSAYGMDEDVPFNENAGANHPCTLYAATKKSAELMGHSYSHLFGIPTTAFRFFTVYGPWGRPDMALFKFVANILNDVPIDVYNHGNMRRDFTYIDDLVEGIIRLTAIIPPLAGNARLQSASVENDSLSPNAAYRLVNVGNSAPVSLLEFIDEIERALGRKAQRNYLDMQPGDVPQTYADTRLLKALTGFQPSTPVAQGVRHFVDWYREFYRAGL
jgi:UDP-glucuronate 4-epimerase